LNIATFIWKALGYEYGNPDAPQVAKHLDNKSRNSLARSGILNVRSDIGKKPLQLRRNPMDADVLTTRAAAIQYPAAIDAARVLRKPRRFWLPASCGVSFVFMSIAPKSSEIE